MLTEDPAAADYVDELLARSRGRDRPRAARESGHRERARPRRVARVLGGGAARSDRPRAGAGGPRGTHRRAPDARPAQAVVALRPLEFVLRLAVDLLRARRTPPGVAALRARGRLDRTRHPQLDGTEDHPLAPQAEVR